MIVMTAVSRTGRMIIKGERPDLAKRCRITRCAIQQTITRHSQQQPDGRRNVTARRGLALRVKVDEIVR